MSRYLEEAARALRAAEKYVNENLYRDRPDALVKIADGFAALAAIDHGLLPPEIVQDLLRAVAARAGARS